VDDTLFYHPEGERGLARQQRAVAAKAVCRTCPVMMECRAEALRTREAYGTWGGLSEDDRAAVLAGKPVREVELPSVTVKPALPPLIRTGPDIPRHAMGRRLPAAPVVEHLRSLRADGYKLADIARAAGLDHSGLSGIASGARATVSERVATLLLGVHADEQGAAGERAA
jgi:WhiB family redox-sensing transcriptional regulator